MASTEIHKTTIAEFTLKELPGNDLKINRVAVAGNDGRVNLTLYDVVHTTDGLGSCTTVDTPMEAWALFRHYSDRLLEQALS